MIVKLVAVAQTRNEAIQKMRRALNELVIEGVKTTAPFHQQLMEDPRFCEGKYTTKFMEEFEIKKPEETN
jgi:acetyl-CoA carboxylase biotin carboxylase subunit